MKAVFGFLKSYWKTLLFFVLAALVGGFLSGLYVLDSYPVHIQQQVEAELAASGLGAFSVDLAIGISTAYQGVIYALLTGIPGILMAKKLGLWKDEKRLTKKPLMLSLGVAAGGGLALILPDVLFFGRYSQILADSYATKPTIVTIFGVSLYGGVIEEVMMRLFALTLVAFILHLIFERKKERVSTPVLVIANLVAAALFAAGHLPVTSVIFGELTPLLLVRCFLLNGGLGLAFGWLYRKYGLRYAMLAHAGCHVVSKLIWILFV